MPEKFRIEISPAAQQDIVEIWEEIAEEHPATATRFISGLEKQVETLKIFPLRCPLIPEAVTSRSEYRHMIHGNYRTIFSIAGNTVRIARIVHGARLLPTEM